MPTIEQSPLEEYESEEALRTDHSVSPTAQWEDYDTMSTTDEYNMNHDSETTYKPESIEFQYSASSTVVLRRARRVNGRWYQSGETVDVRRSRRLALQPRVSYKGMC